MAKQVIILGVSSNTGGEYLMGIVFWYPVTSGQELPIPGATSAYKGASAAEITALQNGSVIEESRTYTIPASYTVAQAQAFLLTMYQAKSAYYATKPGVGNFYGYNYDGSVWHNVHG